jgi:hypothetical protein
MQQDFFDLVWLSLVMFGVLGLPIVLGLFAVLTERD